MLSHRIEASLIGICICCLRPDFLFSRTHNSGDQATLRPRRQKLLLRQHRDLSRRADDALKPRCSRELPVNVDLLEDYAPRLLLIVHLEQVQTIIVTKYNIELLWRQVISHPEWAVGARLAKGGVSYPRRFD